MLLPVSSGSARGRRFYWPGGGFSVYPLLPIKSVVPLGTPPLSSSEIQWAGALGGARPNKVAVRFESCTRSIFKVNYENVNRISVCNCSGLWLYWIGRGGTFWKHYKPIQKQRVKWCRPNSVDSGIDFAGDRDYRFFGNQEKRKEVLMDRLKHLKTRKDARLYFNKNQPVGIRCLTGRCNFEATIQDVSSSGIFISTHQVLQIGEEIAIKFTFPESGNRVQATGEVVRTTDSGIGVEVKIYFQDKRKRYKSRLPHKTDNSKFIS